jgi:SAM-dependent methyltransferase
VYTETAALYDLIYGKLKDYPGEVRALVAVVRGAHPACRTLLDVACGTAEHARLLAADPGIGIEVDGVDLDPAFVAIARAKCPASRFVVADMTSFALGRRYDAVVNLFSSIGYAVTVPRLHAAIACMAAHVAPDGIVVVEPFLTPDTFGEGRTGSMTAAADGLHVTRINRSERVGELCRLTFEYTIEDAAGTRHATELHELGLFTVDDTLAGFAAAGLVADYDPQGPTGRGLYVARPAA